jgi:hypothetical protein
VNANVDCPCRLPLFGAEAGVWGSLDSSTQEQVLQCLALFLLGHLQHTACPHPQEQALTKGTQE